MKRERSITFASKNRRLEQNEKFHNPAIRTSIDIGATG